VEGAPVMASEDNTSRWGESVRERVEDEGQTEKKSRICLGVNRKEGSGGRRLLRTAWTAEGYSHQ